MRHEGIAWDPKGPATIITMRGGLDATEGRRAMVHTTLYGPDGAELARARATWVAVEGR